MNYGEMFIAYDGLTRIGNLKGLTLNLAIVKNKKRMLELIKDVEETYQPTEEYRKFEEERVELCEKYAKKDKEGNSEVDKETNQYIFTDEDKAKFDRALKKLTKTHEEVIDFRKNQLKELEELDSKGADFALVTIKEKDLPRDITTEQLDSLYFMIK